MCKHTVEEMIEGRQKKGEVCIFSSAGQIEQEVHVSESGSAETALERSDKKELNQMHCLSTMDRLKRLKFDLTVTFHSIRKVLNEVNERLETVSKQKPP